MNEHLKGLQERRADKIHQLEMINKKSNFNDSDQLDFDKITNEINEIEAQISQEKKLESKKQKSAERAFDGGYRTGGTPISEDGSIRMYAPDQSVSRDSHPDNEDLSLGQYLRAVVDKPRSGVEKMAVQNSLTSTGYELPTEVGAQIIDKMRAQNPLISAGARTITLDGAESTKFVRLAGDPNTVWHNELVEESTDSPTFDSVEFKPKTLLALTEVSRELLQDAANPQEALETAFTGAMSKAIINASFSSNGAKQPTALDNLINQEQPYSGDIKYADWVKANKKLFDNHTPFDQRSHIMASNMWEQLNTGEDSTGQPLRKPFGIVDIPEYPNGQVPTGIGYAGVFSNVVYGMRLNFTLEQHPAYSAKKYGSLWVAAMRVDMAVFRPSQLVRIEPDA